MMSVLSCGMFFKVILFDWTKTDFFINHVVFRHLTCQLVFNRINKMV